MNKSYLIIPTVLLAVFIVYYAQYSKKLQIITEQKKELAIQQQQEAQRKKDEAIKRAENEARKRDEEQHAKEAREEAARRANWEAENLKIENQTAQYQAQADLYARQAADLEVQLEGLRNDHEKASRELFDLEKQVEQAKIEKRDAELEIQRTYDMVIQKVSGSPIANVTPPPSK